MKNSIYPIYNFKANALHISINISKPLTSTSEWLFILKKAVQFANHVSALTVKNNEGSESFPVLKDCIVADSNTI